MNKLQKQRGQISSSERQLKKQITVLMMSFSDTISDYINNRRQLDQILAQLLKSHRTFKIYKTPAKIIQPLQNKQDLYFEYWMLINISCCYQTKKQTGKACQYLKYADIELTKILELFKRSELDYETQKLETIAVQLKMIKTKLQLCGVYALDIRHIESLEESSQAFALLESVITSICDYSMGEQLHGDFLQLQKCVTEPNTEISEKQIKNSYWNNIMKCESDDSVCNIFISIFKNVHSKEQMQARSCLGKIVTKVSEKSLKISSESKKYLKEFSIGSLMKISPINLEEFKYTLKKQHFVNQQILLELIILLSMTHFTVSTELRIGNACDKSAVTIESLSQEDHDLYKREKKVIEAQRHHFFAIEIIYKMASPYVKECQYFKRLIKGYQEFYLLKDNFEMIAQKVEEENECSIVSAKYKSYTPYDYKEHEDQIIEKMKNTQKPAQKESKKAVKLELSKEKQRIEFKEKEKQKDKEKDKNKRSKASSSKNKKIQNYEFQERKTLKSKEKAHSQRAKI